jgi:Zn-dependent peptidase ImmA (M78 family)
MTLSYELKWKSSTGETAEDGESATWGYLRIMLSSKQLWGTAEISAAPGVHWIARGVHWTWIDLLEHLADSWPWLIGEHGWPPHILSADIAPAEFAVERRRALEQAGANRKRFEQALFDFRERHDLSFALKGKSLPSLWIVRRGNDAWIGDSYAVLPWPEVRDFLVDLGNAIAARLRPYRDERAVQATKRWDKREDAEPLLRGEAITGLDSERLLAVIDGKDPAAALEIVEPGFEPSELAIAARLAAPSLKADTVKKLLGCIRGTALGAMTSELQALSQAALEQKIQNEVAHEEGWQLARWLRHELQLDPNARVDPDELLARWSVSLFSIDLQDPGVDAVACWGPRHGPAIYVNSSGRRAQDNAGRRATVAHEIAHLLVDRDHALPLSEIQGWIHRGRVEKRANAFAAELLMPQSVAGKYLASCNSRSGTRTAVAELSRDFGASREIIAWQAVRSDAALSDSVIDELATYVPEDRQRQIFAARRA